MIVHVNWDTDNEIVEGLPEIVNIPQVIVDKIKLEWGRENFDEGISDWLSDEYGFCVFGWCMAK